MKWLIYLFSTLPLFLHAIEEGVFLEYQQAEQKQKAEEDNAQADYHYPLIEDLKAPTKEKELTLQEQVVNFFGTFVTSSPFPGVRATFEGTELMSQLSSVNKDLQILIELEKSNAYIAQKKLPYPKHPRIFLSGQVEVYAFGQKDATGHPRSDIDLVDAELDFLIVACPWLYGFISFEYDSGTDPTLSNSRVNNSRVHGDSIYVTFGDLMHSPWYATIGQVFIPFGQYSTYNAIHNPLTKALFRMKEREIALGFYNDTWQLAAYVFKGDSYTGSGNNINNYGINLGYHFQLGQLDAKIAAGAIRNIADSEGMQAAFGDPTNTELLSHVVPGFNTNGNFSLGNWTFLYEYNQALKPFSTTDASFTSYTGDRVGAMPKAVDVELAYAFSIKTHPSSLGLSYSRSWQALGFNVPEQRITLTWATYIFQGSLLSVEINQDRLYGKNTRAGGNVVPGNPYFINSQNLGHKDYSFGIDFLLYF
jgi:hypothetical protein